MKRFKSRIAIYLISVVAMVFALILFTGGEALAAAGGTVVEYTYTPTKNNPISKIILEEQTNGNYKVKACIKQSLFTEKIWTFSFVDADCAKAGKVSGLVGYSPNGDDNHVYYYIGGTPWSEIKPGETKNIVCGAAAGYHYEKNSSGSDVLVNDWWNGISGNAAISDYGVKVTAPSGKEVAENESALVQTRDSEKTNPTHQLTFIPQDDGTFQMDVMAQFYIYPYGSFGAKENNKKIDTANCLVYDAEDCLIGEVQYKKPELLLNSTNTTINSVCGIRTLKPGEKIRIYLYVAYSNVDEGKAPADLYNTNGNLLKFEAYEVKVPSVSDVMWTKNLKVASSSIRKVNLKWGLGKVSEYTDKMPVEGYRVRRYNEKGTSLQKTSHVTGTSCSVSLPAYNKKYKMVVQPYCVMDGKKVYGKSASLVVESAKVGVPKATITKISDKIVSMKIQKASNATGTIIYQKVNGTWKKVGSTTGEIFTVSKNTAGKKTYKFRSYRKYDGNTYYSDYSKVYSPLVNAVNYNPFYKYGLDEYDMNKHMWEPEKVYYSNGKLKVKGGFINTHNYNLKHFKIKLTVKCDGIVIGTKTYDAGIVKKNSAKVVTLTMDKSKIGFDLRNGNLKFSYSVLKASK